MKRFLIIFLIITLLFSSCSNKNIDSENELNNDTVEDTVDYDFYINLSDVISDGTLHCAAIKSDGKAIATGLNGGGQCEVFNWSNIKKIEAGTYHTLGLKGDGTVVSTNVSPFEDSVYNTNYGQDKVEEWSDIVDITVGQFHSVGLKSDGTVVAIGRNISGVCDVSTWTNIVQISASSNHTVGLKSDGTVVATGQNYYNQCNVSSWTDIVAVSAGGCHTVGLKSDGTVVSTIVSDDRFNYGQCDVNNWKDIVSISAGDYHTLGVKRDGVVLAVGDNSCNQCAVDLWTDIIAVSAGTSHTLGLKSNGTIVAVGHNDYSRNEITQYNDIMTIKQFENLPSQSTVITTKVLFENFANDNVDWEADTWVLSEDYKYFYLSEIAIDDVVSGKSTYLFNDNVSRWYYTSNHFSTDEIYVYSLLWIYADNRIEPCHKDDPDSYIRLDTSIKTNICVWLPLSYVEKYYNSQVDSNDNINSFDITKTLSLLNLTSKEVSVSDSTDIGLSEKMMKDYISYGGKGETYYSLGRCDGVEGGFLQNGYAFVTADQINKEYIEYFYYAIPDNSSLYLCYVDSEVHICWKNNLPSNVDKATQFVKSVMGEEIPLENIQSNGFYTFWHNDGMLYVNWECNQIFVSTDDGGKTQIYPTDTIGYFQ